MLSNLNGSTGANAAVLVLLILCTIVRTQARTRKETRIQTQISRQIQRRTRRHTTILQSFSSLPLALFLSAFGRFWKLSSPRSPLSLGLAVLVFIFKLIHSSVSLTFFSLLNLLLHHFLYLLVIRTIDSHPRVCDAILLFLHIYTCIYISFTCLLNVPYILNFIHLSLSLLLSHLFSYTFILSFYLSLLIWMVIETCLLSIYFALWVIWCICCRSSYWARKCTIQNRAQVNSLLMSRIDALCFLALACSSLF